MNNFKFKIKDYFCLQNNIIGLTGTMLPADFPVVTKDYNLQLVSNDQVVHTFENIGEEIPSRTSSAIRVRAFRTSDDIKYFLDSENIDDLYIIGYKL